MQLACAEIRARGSWSAPTRAVVEVVVGVGVEVRRVTLRRRGEVRFRRLAVGLGLAGFDFAILLALALWAWRLARLKARRFRHSRAEWQRNLEWVRQKLS